MRATLGTRWRSGSASGRSKQTGSPPDDCVGWPVHHFRRLVAIEKLVPAADDENAAKQKDDRGESECDAQRRNAGLFNHRNGRGYWVRS